MADAACESVEEGVPRLAAIESREPRRDVGEDGTDHEELAEARVEDELRRQNENGPGNDA